MKNLIYLRKNLAKKITAFLIALAFLLNFINLVNAETTFFKDNEEMFVIIPTSSNSRAQENSGSSPGSNSNIKMTLNETKICEISEEDLTNGYKMHLNLNDTCKFEINSEEHTLILNSFDPENSKVTINLILIILSRGKDLEIDINQDQKKDLKLIYLGIEKGEAVISIQSLPANHNTLFFSPPEKTDKISTKKGKRNYSVFALIILIISVCILYFNRILKDMAYAK